MANKRDPKTPLTRDEVCEIIREQERKGIQMMKASLLESDEYTQRYKAVLLNGIGHNEESINKISARLFYLSNRSYRGLFEYVEKELGAKATVSDYHKLYRWCLDVLLLSWYEDFFFLRRLLIQDDSLSQFDEGVISKTDFLERQLRELDVIFEEFAGKVENPNSYDLKKIIVNFMEEVKKENEKPEYNKKLIENGYIAPDGITAIASLDNIAEFIYSLGLDSFNYKLLMQYRQIDGSHFSENSAKEAAKRCKIKK